MTSAGMLCSDVDDPVILLIEKTVKIIIRNFTDNPNIFSESLDVFNKTLSEIENNTIDKLYFCDLDEKTEILEETVEAEVTESIAIFETIEENNNLITLSFEESQYPSTDVSFSCVDHIIKSLRQRHTIPNSLYKLVNDGWRQVLQHSREQNESDEQWYYKINTIEMLLWNLQGNHQKDIDPDDWLILKNCLIDQLNEVEVHPCTITEWLHSINALISFQIDLEEEIVLEHKEDDIIDTLPQPDIIESSEVDIEQEDKPLHEATQPENMPDLKDGQWVEFIGKDNHHLRCKLATINTRSNRYIFVNKSGMKVAEWSGVELAKAISLQNVKILDSNQFFDRALHTVMENFLKF